MLRDSVWADVMVESSKLVVATSSSALFDLSDSDRVFREQGLAAYADYQIANEAVALAPGDAYPLVEKLLRLNGLRPNSVEVILLSRNSADTGLRVFNSIQHHRLPITRAAFTGGAPPYRYMAPFECHLFLSTNVSDVRQALDNGFAAATILAGTREPLQEQDVLHFAFDGDAVLFSDEAERVYQADGLSAFSISEKDKAHEPLGGGPFRPFLAALKAVQAEFGSPSPIRTALVTARAAPAHERVIRTLRNWDIRLDESLFLGGMDKSAFLQAYGADVFFDDQMGHCEPASRVATTGHVPSGAVNDVPQSP